MEYENETRIILQDDTVVAPLLPGTAKERRAGRILEHLPHAFTRLGRTFEIMPGVDLLCDGHALIRV